MLSIFVDNLSQIKWLKRMFQRPLEQMSNLFLLMRDCLMVTAILSWMCKSYKRTRSSNFQLTFSRTRTSSAHSLLLQLFHQYISNNFGILSSVINMVYTTSSSMKRGSSLIQIFSERRWVSHPRIPIILLWHLLLVT